MFPSIKRSTTALQPYEPDARLFFTIETAARLSHVPRRSIAVYCRQGLVAPVMDPESAGWFFNDEGIRRLRRIEHLRVAFGMNMPAIRMILNLAEEVEELRRELRFLRRR